MCGGMSVCSLVAPSLFQNDEIRSRSGVLSQLFFCESNDHQLTWPHGRSCCPKSKHRCMPLCFSARSQGSEHNKPGGTRWEQPQAGNKIWTGLPRPGDCICLLIASEGRQQHACAGAAGGRHRETTQAASLWSAREGHGSCSATLNELA